MSSALLCPFDSCQLLFPTQDELATHIELRHVEVTEVLSHIPDTLASTSTHTVDRSFETSSSHLPSPASPNMSSFLPGFTLPDNPMSSIELKTDLILYIAGHSRLDEITILVLKDIGFSQFQSNEKFDVTALRNLRELNLNQNYLHDVTAIAQLTSLEVLSLDNNQIAQVSALASLRNLRSLSLIKNIISHLSTFPVLPLLADLKLSGNQLKDFTDVVKALERLPALLSLCIDGNPFVQQQKHVRYKVLRHLHLQSLDGEEVTAFDHVIAAEVVKPQEARAESKDAVIASLISETLLDAACAPLLKQLKRKFGAASERELRRLAAEVLSRHSVFA